MPQQDKAEHVLDEFMGDKTRASQLRVWREALEERLERLRAEVRANPAAMDSLKPKIESLQKQVLALKDEEAITGFVEDSVRAVVADIGQTHSPPDRSEEYPPRTSQDADSEDEI